MSIRERLLTGDLLPAMAGLGPRHRDVIRLRYGLDDDVERDCGEIAKLFGCPVEEIIVLEQEAVAHLELFDERRSRSFIRRDLAMQVDDQTTRLVMEIIKRVERTSGRAPDVREIATSLSIPESYVVAILDRLGSDEQNEGTSAFQNSLRDATNSHSAQLGLAEEEWATVQQMRRQTGEPISVILHRLGFASSHQIKNALELQFGVNFVDLKSREPQPELIRLIPTELQRRYKMVPIAQHGRRVSIAMVNPNDLQALESARRELPGLEIRSMVCTLEDFLDFLYRSGTT